MSDVNSADFWESLYQSNRYPWDLNGPTPVFQRLARHHRFDPGTMLVLGAGHGHDARLFARNGFAVTAVDFAAEAVEAMKRLDDPAFPVEILRTDFFSLSADWNGRFDYVLDYTSFCAILPERRPDYADLVTRLLKPGGQFIILAFPIGKRPGGPPFVVQPDAIIALFGRRRFELGYRETPFDSVDGRKGHEELLVLVKT